MEKINGKVFVSVLIVLILAGALVVELAEWKHVNAPPPVFVHNGGFETAVELAAEHDRLLIIDMTAEWCPPCKLMDETTWLDDAVMAWVNEFGVATQVDVDQRTDLANQYQIDAMPTVVVQDGTTGDELGRVVGYMDADQMVAWLEGVRTAANRLEPPMEDSTSTSTSKSEDG